MAKLALNKSSLNQQTRQLKSFEQFLPSLDLKRRQLIAERAKAVEVLAKTQQQLEQSQASVIARDLPMLANEHVDLIGIANISEAHLVEENVMGTRLPVLKAVHIQVCDYALMGKPHWVDRVVEYLKTALELRLKVQVAERRLDLLDAAVKTITQRVNLFDKILIPQTKANIQKIRIYLADAERSGVVNAKLAKAKLRVTS